LPLRKTQDIGGKKKTKRREKNRNGEGVEFNYKVSNTSRGNNPSGGIRKKKKRKPGKDSQ